MQLGPLLTQSQFLLAYNPHVLWRSEAKSKTTDCYIFGVGMCDETKCLKCRGEKQVYGSRWCGDCWYPGIDEVYNEYRAMLAEGYRSADAAVRSGWLGVEEI